MSKPIQTSVVVTTYNGEKYIEKQLDSIVSQTVPPDEIVVFDDLSTDNTLAIINQYAETSNINIAVVQNTHNLGINENFRQALVRSRGDIVFISDQDDIWEANKLEIMLEHHSDEMLVYSNASLIDESGKVICDKESAFFNFTPIEGSNPLYFLLNNCISGHNALVTRELIEIACKTKIPEGMLYDQWLAYFASLYSKISYIDLPLCNHRIHENNSHNRQRKINTKSKKARFVEKSRRSHDLYEALLFATPSSSECFPLLSSFVEHFENFSASSFNTHLFSKLMKIKRQYANHLSPKKETRKIFKLCLGARLWWLAYV